uniref:Uncharacterized protein n=1 Tax=Vitis vinifera TaxID=29760 RepID=F6HJB2_VITVI
MRKYCGGDIVRPRATRFYIALEPRRMGYLVAVERFVKIMAMVWAGSQVTKLVRARGALALAPIVDRGLSWFTVKFRFESQGKIRSLGVGNLRLSYKVMLQDGGKRLGSF